MKKYLLSMYKIAFKILSGTGIEKFYPVRVVHGFIISHTTFAEVDGHKMFLDSKDSLGLSIPGNYEPFETELVKSEIKKGDVVLDIGAHIGYYTVIFAKLVGEKGKVFAFEPDPANFSLLKKNVEINGYKNVELVQKAVSNKTGRLRLYLHEGNTGGRVIYNPHRYDYHQSIEIESIRLDDYFKGYDGNINFIKIDIEGAEGMAIEGMLNLLKKNSVKIVTEFWPRTIAPSAPIGSVVEAEEYLELLTKLGFKLYDVDELEKKIKPVNIRELFEIYTLEKENHTNLFCTKEENGLE